MNTKEKEPAVVGATASSAESSVSIKDSANSITFKFANVKQAKLVFRVIKARIIRCADAIEKLARMDVKSNAELIRSYSDEISELTPLLKQFDEEVC